MPGDGGVQLLEDSVIKLSAHAGYQTANSSTVMVLTDATSQYLKTFCSMLRRELDTRLDSAPTDSHGWDALEKVCVEMKVRWGLDCDFRTLTTSYVIHLEIIFTFNQTFLETF